MRPHAFSDSRVSEMPCRIFWTPSWDAPPRWEGQRARGMMSLLVERARGATVNEQVGL